MKTRDQRTHRAENIYRPTTLSRCLRVSVSFRIFIPVRARRLQSDRFLNVDCCPEIYSHLELEWIENNGMSSIILRHCAQLASVLPRTTSAFSPLIKQAQQSPSMSELLQTSSEPRAHFTCRTRFLELGVTRLRPEYGRVLKWIVDRVHGRGYGVESPIGWMPRHEDIEWKGLDLPADVFYQLMAVGRWQALPRRRLTKSNSTCFSIDCLRNSSSSVSFCARGCGVRPIVGNLLERMLFGRQLMPHY